MASLFPKRRNWTHERELLRVACEIGDCTTKAFESVQKEILKWATNQVASKLPISAWEGKKFEHLYGGRLCSGVTVYNDAGKLWALRTIIPDAAVAQRIWTAEVVVGSNAGGPSLIGLRLLVSSPEEELQISPAVPGLLRQVSSLYKLTCDGNEITQDPVLVQSIEATDSLIDYLVDPTRKLPVIICSVPENDSFPTLNSKKLSECCIGIAKIAVVSHECCWHLTRSIGKTLSTYGGAVRAYLPGFSYSSSPFSHPLFLPDMGDLRTWAKATSSSIRWTAANESIRHTKIGVDVLSFSAVRDKSLDIERAKLLQDGSTDAIQLEVAQAQITALKEDCARSQGEVCDWLAAYEGEEQKCQELRRQLTAAQGRIQHLIAQVKKGGASPDGDIVLPTSWDKFADWCDDVLTGRVVLSSRARREVRAPHYDSPQTAAQCLLWLANEYRDAKINGSENDLRLPVTDGIRNDRCGAEAFDFIWNGVSRDVDWHIKNGGTTRDPLRCLRIYYFWDEVTQHVVVATMPAHIRTEAT